MRSTLIFFFMTSLLVSLGACLPTGDTDTSAKPDTTSKIVAKPGLTPSQRNTEALNLLDKGKVEQARVELLASLAEWPAEKNPKAKDYLDQIDGDPVKLLGSKNFNYEVKKGETLASIAKEHLGDPFKFYALARYNGMDNPSLLKVGQTIKVPGKEPNPESVAAITPEPGPEPEPDTPPEPDTTEKVDPPKPEPDTTEKVDPPKPEPEELATERKMKLFAAAREKSDAGNLPGAIEIIEDALTQFPQDQMFKVYGGDVYGKFGGDLLEQDKYQAAAEAAERGAALNPESADLAKRVADAKKGLRADGLYQDGQKYEASQANIEALESYKAALKVWPNHDPAQIALARVGPKVADEYYRAARTAYQRHDLEKALEYYDKTLEIDATHEPAKLERQRTIQLIDKLKQAG